jgi:quinol monooxygenase YgiN
MTKLVLAIAVIAALTVQLAQTSSPNEAVHHVALFHFSKQHVDEAATAFREMASASRRERGNLRYDVYRGVDDPQSFYIVEDWASPAALEAHENSDAFARFGQGVLTKYATLHDTLTGDAFDVAAK